MVFGQSMPSKLALPLLSSGRKYLMLRMPISTASFFLKTDYIAETGLYKRQMGAYLLTKTLNKNLSHLHTPIQYILLVLLIPL